MRAAGGDPVRALLSRVVDRGLTPGAVWHVEGAGEPLRRGSVGLAARLPGPCPARVETPYDLASLTKPLVTALLFVLLEQEGRLDPDEPVGQRLAELRGSAHAGATLLALATHTAGLAAWWPLCVAGSTREAYLETIASLPRTTEPGQVLYSDLGYILLGVVIERETGTDLAALFHERVVRPLGLARLGFTTGPGAWADAAATERGNAYERRLAGERGAGYAWRTELLRGQVHDANAHGLGGVAGHAGLFGTAEAVARLGREMLRPQVLDLGPRARARLLRPAVGCAGRTVGFVTAEFSGAARGLLPTGAPGHTGFTGTSLWLDPQRERVLVLLANRVHPVVPEREFRSVRRAFHRLARRLAR